MINNILGGIAYSTIAPNQLGTAIDFSVLSNTTTTVAGATSCNLFSGGTTAQTGASIGSAQHYGNVTSTQALADLQTAYDYYKGLTPTGNFYVGASVTPDAASPIFPAGLAGLRFTPGVFYQVAAVTNALTVTFDAEGDPNAQFIMQCGAAFAPAASSNMVLINGAKSKNIFWVITGSPTPAAGAHMEGTFISLGLFSLAAGATANGRVMTVGTGAITLSANTITTT
jgi:hypothetical protein